LRPHLLQVVAGGEGAPRGRDHHDAHARIRRDRVERHLQRADQLLGERVGLVRAVERQRGDAVPVVAEQQSGSFGIAGFHRRSARLLPFYCGRRGPHPQTRATGFP
jgi:hypothetical protein